MLKIKETKHSYYCECWESKRISEHKSWEDFKEEVGLDYDFDYNLLFRFDIEQLEDNCGKKINNFTLELHHALQRHGREQWHAIIYNITQSDLEEIEEHLKKAKQHLLEMWKEIETT